MAADLKETVNHFQFDEAVASAEPYGKGHINDTYLVEAESGQRLILQRMNHTVFRNPAETLHETIEKFHDTRARFARSREVVEADPCGRAASVQKEIQFVLDHEDVANVFAKLQDAGELPLRATHNDTKLNNIMMDKKTGKGICVIDLDTVMPGLWR